MPRHAKKESILCIWVSYFFLEYPFGAPYLELSSEIRAQDFNLLVNIDSFFPVFLLIIIGNSFHQIHTSFEELLNWCHLGIIIKVVSKLPVVITVVTIDNGLMKSTIGKSHYVIYLA